MLTRIISGTAVGVISIFFILMGGNVLAAALFIVSCIAFRELSGAIGIKSQTGAGPLEIAGYAGIIAYYIMLVIFDGRLFMEIGGIPLSFLVFLLQIGIMIIMLAVYVFTFPRYNSNQVMSAYFSFIYGPVMLSFVYLTQRLDIGLYAVWLVFLSSWVCDTCAYFFGVALGKHKMTPVLSPKKTIEGALGGIAGSVVLGALYGKLISGYLTGVREFPPGRIMPVFAVICGVGALISMIGDLAASAIKRNHDIKDYGTLIPGHGGIMDRFDSVIFTAPIIYFMSVLLL